MKYGYSYASSTSTYFRLHQPVPVSGRHGITIVWVKRQSGTTADQEVFEISTKIFGYFACYFRREFARSTATSTVREVEQPQTAIYSKAVLEA